jgi:hypothetical protein
LCRQQQQLLHAAEPQVFASFFLLSDHGSCSSHLQHSSPPPNHCPPSPPDSNAPTWANNLDGQVNLRDALRRTITFTAPNGKYYKLRPEGELATLLVR